MHTWIYLSSKEDGARSLSLTFRQVWKETLTTVVHAVEPFDVSSTEVKSLANDIIKIGNGGYDCGYAWIYVEGQGSVVHDRLIIIGCVQISNEVILILIEIVLPSCVEKVTCVCREAIRSVKGMIICCHLFFLVMGLWLSVRTSRSSWPL